MAIRINGDNTTAAPGITRGDDTDTGIQFGTDEISFVTGGTEKVKVDNGALKVTGQSSGITDGGITFDWESVSQSGRIFAESSAASQFKFFTTNSSGVRSERLRIQSDGGISFNGDGSAANALDDYEEGTFTVKYQTDGGTDVTMSTIVDGVYTKIGRTVFFSFRAASNDSPIPAGNIRVAGLPFTVRSSTQNRDGGGAITEMYRWATNFISVNQMVQVSTINGTDLIRLMKQVTSADPSQDFVDNTDMDTGLNQNILSVTGHYFTDQ